MSSIADDNDQRFVEAFLVSRRRRNGAGKFVLRAATDQMPFKVLDKPTQVRRFRGKPTLTRSRTIKGFLQFGHAVLRIDQFRCPIVKAIAATRSG
jgi:hypothetical protein